MKNQIFNKIVKLSNNCFSVKKPHTLSLKRLLFVLIFSFPIVNILAQNSDTNTPTIMEVKSYIASLKADELKSPSSFSNAQKVQSLVSDLQPSIYFNSGITKTYGENPKNLYTDIASLNGIKNASFQKNNIEIVIINITNLSELNSKIDLGLFSDFYKLKYIYIVSTVNTTEQNITKMFLNYDEQYSIFYRIEEGE
jgi:hypothetical protein